MSVNGRRVFVPRQRYLMNFDDYYMGIAIAVRERANCKGRRVGAVIVRDNRIVSTGYNGTPEGFANCEDGGCIRCQKRAEYSPGNYDICICVHAEQNAIVTAARFGISLEGATCYTTMRPCFSCTKEMLQAKIVRVVYLHELGLPHGDAEIDAMYHKLQSRLKVDHLQSLEDPRREWAMRLTSSK